MPPAESSSPVSFCGKHFVNAEGGRLLPDEVQPLSLPRPFISLSNKRTKSVRYQSASLGDELVTIVITMVHLWNECPFICASLIKGP